MRADSMDRVVDNPIITCLYPEFNRLAAWKIEKNTEKHTQIERFDVKMLDMNANITGM